MTPGPGAVALQVLLHGCRSHLSSGGQDRGQLGLLQCGSPEARPFLPPRHLQGQWEALGLF